MEPSGVLLWAKTAGVTSHDVVAGVRRNLSRGVKVGHAGTLDPFATGLLLVLVGRATRAQRFLMALPKTYRAVARLGAVSDTGDRDGAITVTGRVPDRLELPIGRLLQRPPAYSAVRVSGERLYARARRGEPVEGEPRPVTVHRFRELWRDDERVGLEIECSAGTYVRQLVAGLGDAYCEELERTAIGPFRLEDADEERLVPLDEALSFFPERALEPEEAKRASHGVAVEMADRAWQMADQVRPVAGEAPQGDFVRLTSDGRLVAIAERRAGALKPVVVLGG